MCVLQEKLWSLGVEPGCPSVPRQGRAPGIPTVLTVQAGWAEAALPGL